MKKILSFLIAMLMLCMSICVPFSANAAGDTASAAMGFSIDTSEFKTVSWRARKVSTWTYSGTSVGTVYVDIGTTTAKQKVYYSGKYYYLDAVLLRISYAGTGGGSFWKGYKYGYVDDQTVEVNVGANNILWGYSPTQTATSISYTIGGEAGASFSKSGPEISLGISGSQSFQKDALSIKDKSTYGTSKSKIIFDYDNYYFWRWNWSYSEYSYNTSSQLMLVYALSTASKYEVTICNTTSMDLGDSEPNYWMNWLGIEGTGSRTWSVSVCH